MSVSEKCHRHEANKKTYLILYETKDAVSTKMMPTQAAAGTTANKKGTLPIAAICIAICPYCLARMAWKKIGGALAAFVIGTTAASLLAWLLSNVFSIAWIGAVVIALGLFVNLIKTFVTSIKTADRLGAARYAWDNYVKQGGIPRNAFVWINEKSLDMFSEDKLPLTINGKNCSDDFILTDEATLMETMTKSADVSSEETETILKAFSAAKAACPQTQEGKLPSVKKCFLRPVVASLVMATAIMTSVLFIIEAVEKNMYGDGNALAIIIAVAAGIFGIFGGFLLWKRKKAGYAFSGLMLALLWFFAIGSGSNVLMEDSIIISVIVAIPSLLYIPFIRE